VSRFLPLFLLPLLLPPLLLLLLLLFLLLLSMCFCCTHNSKSEDDKSYAEPVLAGRNTRRAAEPWRMAC
jgi:hypothetical protein